MASGYCDGTYPEYGDASFSLSMAALRQSVGNDGHTLCARNGIHADSKDSLLFGQSSRGTWLRLMTGSAPFAVVETRTERMLSSAS